MAQIKVDSDLDILIIGGGLVGIALVLALQSLASPGASPRNSSRDSSRDSLGFNLKIALIDQQSPEDFFKQKQKDISDTRTLALSFSSVQFLKNLDNGELWKTLEPFATPIQHLHISEAGTASLLRLHAEEYGEFSFGYVIPIIFLYKTLWEKLQKNLSNSSQLQTQTQTQTQIQFQCPSKVVSINAESGEVSLENNKVLKAKLILACDGGNSFVRKFLNLKTEVKDYEQTALVTSVLFTQSHKNWAFERFLPEEVLALLPLQGEKQAGLVWVQSANKTEEAVNWPDDFLLKILQERFGGRLGDFLALGPRHTYPLHKIIAKEIFSGRVLLMGNAAHQLNPVGAQGWNLSLRDIGLLIKLIQKVPGLSFQTIQSISSISSISSAGSLSPDLNFNHQLREALFEPYFAASAKDQAQIENITEGIATLYSAKDGLSVFARRSVMAALKLSGRAREEFVLTLMGKKAYWEIQ